MTINGDNQSAAEQGTYTHLACVLIIVYIQKRGDEGCFPFTAHVYYITNTHTDTADNRENQGENWQDKREIDKEGI